MKTQEDWIQFPSRLQMSCILYGLFALFEPWYPICRQVKS